MPRARAASPNGKLRVLSIGVVGTIGEADRKAVAAHPDAEIVGLCDVDSNYLAQAAKDHPNAFTCKDYREAFAKHADKFDAVIVSVPDFSHAPMILTAMAHDKHVYGQKPLVHQLAELAMVEMALKTKPNLVTQLGNQRMVHPGRRAALEILRDGKLGKAIEACLLVVKATRFPGQELLWDKSKLAFTNHAEATNTIVRRQYREGFAPPRVG